MVTKEILAEVTQRLVAVYDPVSIYLFGSYAWGKPTPESDIDLLVIVKETTGPEVEMMVEGQVALASMRIPKDILVNTEDFFEKRAAQQATLQHLIKDKGVLLYEHQK